ncbi:MAG: hypothetical protein A3F41_01480 [Coxiella sp. RIFCSPHIGHO2_12_FULL_44_14]|nr:MAG: hypothetical protein A3F41_01480 [Coxiella sp. RIFCSPHIGHO2_12_FULL_44_14]
MTYENYFPRGVAGHAAFCNRLEERKRLARNVKTGQHTLLMSPRRYGKTSLVNYVIDEINFPVGNADLFVAVDATHIEQRILSGIKMLLNHVCGSVEQVLRSLRDYFKRLDTQWTIGTQGVHLILSPANKDHDAATTIMEALLALEYLLEQKNKRAVIFLDEMQEIGEVAEGKGIEGAIRHVAQQSKYLSFIFSGSNRHLLRYMFYDKARPLYKLCDRINLERISEKDYAKHLSKLSQKRWRKSLSDESLSRIFALTERHPYHMNNLCLRLWESELKQLPQPEDIESTWLQFAKEDRLEVARELSMLSAGQRKILICVASGYNQKLTGKEFLKKINMTSSSVTESLQILEQKDYVEKHKSEYRIIDPLIKTMLNVYFEV